MKATTLLAAQHRDLEALLARVTFARDPSDWAFRLETLTRALVAHDTVEREIFYPRCEQTGLLVRRGELLSDHIVDLCLYDRDTEMNQATGAEKIEVLAKALRRHRLQEQPFFTHVEAGLGERDLDLVGASMAELFERVNGGDHRAALIERLGRDLAARPKTRKISRPALELASLRA